MVTKNISSLPPKAPASSDNPAASRSALNFRILKSHEAGSGRAPAGVILGAAAGLAGSLLNNNGNLDKKSTAYAIAGAGVGALLGYGSGAAAGDLNARIKLQEKIFENQIKHDRPDADIVLNLNESAAQNGKIVNTNGGGNGAVNSNMTATIQQSATDPTLSPEAIKLRSLRETKIGGRRAVPAAIVGAAAGGYGALKAANVINNHFHHDGKPLTALVKKAVIAGGAVVGGAAIGSLGYASGKAAGNLDARIYLEKKLAEQAIKDNLNQDQLSIVVQEKV